MKNLLYFLLIPALLAANGRQEAMPRRDAAALQAGAPKAISTEPVNKFTAPRPQTVPPDADNLNAVRLQIENDVQQVGHRISRLSREVQIARARAVAPFTAPSPRGLESLIKANQKTAGAKILWNSENGTPAFVTYANQPGLKKRQRSSDFLERSYTFLQENASFLYLQNPRSELVLTDMRTDELGHSHLRFQQHYQNIPVWGAELYLHYGADGELSVMNGRRQPTPEGMAPEFNLSREQAIARAAAHLAFDAAGASIWEAERVIFIDDRGKAKAVWHIQLGAAMFEDWRVFIDARDGKVLQAYDNRQTGTPAKGSGIDLSGQSRALDIYKIGGDYYLLNAAKSMFNGAALDKISDMQGIIAIGDARNVAPDQFNTLYYVKSTATNAWPANAVSLSWVFSQTYDYFKNVHGLTSLDNGRHNVIGIVNMGKQYNNAFWHGGIKMFCFGNGDGQALKDLASSLDIIAHEYGHGVTQYGSALEYQFQSGALNEAFSDFTGVMVEFYADPANADWLIAEDCMPAFSAYNCMRDLTNPGSSRAMERSPAKMSEYANLTIDQDNGGVHVNSTIPGHAFYVLSTLMPREKMEKIIYRAYRQYLTRRSQFIDLRLAAVQAAKDLYPSDNSAALVGQAFDRVEIFDGTETKPDTPLPPVEGEDYVLALFHPSGELFQIKSAVPYQDGNAKSFGVYSVSKPSVTEDGSIIVYVDGNGNINLFDAVEKQNYVLTDNGYFANVAISPRADYIAYTPKYDVLPSTIFIYNLNTGESVSRTLTIPTTTQGAEILADYADVLDWTTEGGWLIFDCAFSINDQNGKVDTWGIYLTNAAEDAIVPIFQPDARFAVGNPSFSGTRDNVIAFDVLDYSNNRSKPEYYLYAYDLFSGKLGLIHKNLLTFGHPSFSPDDSRVVFQDQSNEGTPYLLQVTMGEDGLNAHPGTLKTWVNPVKFPVWYAVGSRPAEMQTLFEENFEVTFPPAGWLAPESAHADYGWRWGNVKDHDFSAVDPANTASALCGYNPAEMQVDRLLSPAFNLSGDATLTFWAGYNLGWTGNFEVNVYLTKSGAVDPDQAVWRIKVEGNDGKSDWQWRECTVDLGRFSSRQNVRLLWEYRGKDGDMFALDGVKLAARSGGQAVHEPVETLPGRFVTVSNYPNPFNAETTLVYQLQQAGEVTLQIFNVKGEWVETLVDREYQSAGTFRRNWRADVGSGIYFYRLTTPDGIAVGKAIVMK